MQGFPELGVPCFAGPHNMDPNFGGGLYWGPPNYGNYHLGTFYIRVQIMKLSIDLTLLPDPEKVDALISIGLGCPI